MKGDEITQKKRFKKSFQFNCENYILFVFNDIICGINKTDNKFYKVLSGEYEVFSELNEAMVGLDLSYISSCYCKDFLVKTIDESNMYIYCKGNFYIINLLSKSCECIVIDGSPEDVYIDDDYLYYYNYSEKLIYKYSIKNKNIITSSIMCDSLVSFLFSDKGDLYYLSMFLGDKDNVVVCKTDFDNVNDIIWVLNVSANYAKSNGVHNNDYFYITKNTNLYEINKDFKSFNLITMPFIMSDNSLFYMIEDVYYTFVKIEDGMANVVSFIGEVLSKTCAECDDVDYAIEYVQKYTPPTHSNEAGYMAYYNNCLASTDNPTVEISGFASGCNRDSVADNYSILDNNYYYRWAIIGQYVTDDGSINATMLTSGYNNVGRYLFVNGVKIKETMITGNNPYRFYGFYGNCFYFSGYATEDKNGYISKITKYNMKTKEKTDIALPINITAYDINTRCDTFTYVDKNNGYGYRFVSTTHYQAGNASLIEDNMYVMVINFNTDNITFVKAKTNSYNLYDFVCTNYFYSKSCRTFYTSSYQHIYIYDDNLIRVVASDTNTDLVIEEVSCSKLRDGIVEIKTYTVEGITDNLLIHDIYDYYVFYKDGEYVLCLKLNCDYCGYYYLVVKKVGGKYVATY